jgi:hypothetical protein
VVRDAALRQQAVDKVLDFARETLGLTLLGVVPSAVRGPKGNQEYMACWKNKMNRRKRRNLTQERLAESLILYRLPLWIFSCSHRSSSVNYLTIYNLGYDNGVFRQGRQ